MEIYRHKPDEIAVCNLLCVHHGPKEKHGGWPVAIDGPTGPQAVQLNLYNREDVPEKVHVFLRDGESARDAFEGVIQAFAHDQSSIDQCFEFVGYL